MNFPKIILSLFVLLVVDSPLAAEEIPALKGVTLKASVSHNATDGAFVYDYLLGHSAESTGDIQHMDIDVTLPEGGAAPSGAGLTIPIGKKERTFEQELQTVPGAVQMVPVGLRAPTDWLAGLTVRGSASWGGGRDGVLIPPSKSLSGFTIISRGLPTIRNARVKPDFVLTVEGSIAQEDIERARQIDQQITVSVKTLGPTAPPAVVVPLNFLASLVALKHEAQALGWVGGPKFVAKLDKKLDQVRQKLTTNNLKSARGKLKAFIEKVESQFKETKAHEVERAREAKKDQGKNRDEKKFVTSEGHALLTFNAQFLRDRLPVPPGKDKDPDKDDTDDEASEDED